MTDDTTSDMVTAVGRRLRLAAEPGQVADDRAGAGAFLVDQREVGAHAFVHLRVMLEQLRKPGDRLQRIVQLVGDAGHEHADGREPFLPDHLLLQRFELEAHAPFLLDLPRDRFARGPSGD